MRKMVLFSYSRSFFMYIPLLFLFRSCNYRCLVVCFHYNFLYFRLTYSILGQCDLTENHSDIISNIDDFLWIKISQVIAQEPSESVVASKNSMDDTFTLGQLQTLLYETYGMNIFVNYCIVMLYMISTFL